MSRATETPVTAAREAVGRRRRASTLSKLMDAAMRVIARCGVDGASIDDIIIEAGVSRGTFYNYFSTREDVLIAVAGVVSDRLLARLVDQRSLPDPAERVAGAVRGFIRLAAEDADAGWVIVRIALIAAPIGDAMAVYLHEDVTEGLASGRFQAASPQAARDLILGMGMMGMRSVLQGDREVGHAEDVAELVLRALSVPDATSIARKPIGG